MPERFQHLGAVRGQQEEDVGVVCKAIHLVEQLEQYAVATRAVPAPLFRDQVDVLDDDSRGLK
jgi:hypothetical protein